jgi:hypothetical protein
MPFDLDWVGRRTHYVAVALNPFVYFYARPAHALMLSYALGLAGAAITPCNVQSIADRSHKDACPCRKPKAIGLRQRIG